MGRARDCLPSVFTGLLSMPVCLQECYKDNLALILEMACFIQFWVASRVMIKRAGKRALTVV